MEDCKLTNNMPCVKRFSIQHGMIYKKRGFASTRHNDRRSLTAKMLSEVCKDKDH